MRRVRRAAIAFALLISLMLVGGAGTVSAESHGDDSGFKHIFIIMMENHATNQIFGNTADAPFTNHLASRAAVATDYFGVTHPSLPNYLAAISGDFQHIWDDCKAGTTVNGQTVPIKLYAQKHDPFMYFPAIRNNPERMEKIVPFTQFDGDLDSGNVPNFVWISPDQCHDMHGVSTSHATFLNLPDCAFPASGLDHSIIKLGDNYLRDTVNEITESSVWRNTKSALVIVWDENDYSSANGCCHSPIGVDDHVLGGSNAPALVLTSRDQEQFVSATPYNHYSLLATIERLWGLGCLENACGFSNSELMTNFFG